MNQEGQAPDNGSVGADADFHKSCREQGKPGRPMGRQDSAEKKDERENGSDEDSQHRNVRQIGQSCGGIVSAYRI